MRLCPEDATRVEEARGGKPGMPGVTAAEIEVRADASLSPGDCVVDADFGVIDGRLDTRFDELRRILRETVGAGHGGHK